MKCIHIKRLWSDEHMIELEFSARSVNIQSQLNFYETEEDLIDLKEKLVKFPVNKNDLVEWEAGSKDKNSYAYFKFKAFLYDKQGHVAIEIQMDNKLEKPYSLYSHFYILTEVGSINDFGRKLGQLLTEDGASIEGIAWSN